MKSEDTQLDVKSLVFENPKLLPASFNDCPNLQVLVIKGYEHKKLESKIFRGIFNLKTLNVTKNILTVLNGNEFDDLRSLEILNLKSNAITDIPTEEFSTLVELKELYLDENEIKALDKRTFVNNVNLETLSLSSNRIVKLQYKTFASLHKLREIDLSLNGLTTLQSAIFSNNIDLERLYLYNNNLHHIESSIFQQLRKLIRADFEENPCIPRWIPSIAILNETIYLSCKVNETIELEWKNDELQELKGEIDSLKSQLSEKTEHNKQPSIQTTPSLFLPAESVKNNIESKCPDLNLELNEKLELKEKLEAQRREIEELKTNLEESKKPVTRYEEKNDEKCQEEKEILNLELNSLEEENEKLKENCNIVGKDENSTSIGFDVSQEKS